MKIDSPNAIGISTGFGIPTGGTANQVLVKNSSTNYDTSWSDFTGTTLVQAQNTSGQSIANNTTPTITNWTNLYTQSDAEWNATTGVFTATKSGTYLVSSNLTYAAKTAAQTANTVRVLIFKNSSSIAASVMAAINTTTVVKGTGTATAILNLVVGDTITIRTFHDLGSAALLNTTDGWNNVTIQEISSKIRR